MKLISTFKFLLYSTPSNCKANGRLLLKCFLVMLAFPLGSTSRSRGEEYDVSSAFVLVLPFATASKEIVIFCSYLFKFMQFLEESRRSIQ